MSNTDFLVLVAVISQGYTIASLYEAILTRNYTDMFILGFSLFTVILAAVNFYSLRLSIKKELESKGEKNG